MFGKKNKKPQNMYYKHFKTLSEAIRFNAKNKLEGTIHRYQDGEFTFILAYAA